MTKYYELINKAHEGFYEDLARQKQSHGRIEPFLVGYDGLLRPIAREPSFCDLRKG